MSNEKLSEAEKLEVQLVSGVNWALMEREYALAARLQSALELLGHRLMLVDADDGEEI